MFTFAPLSVLQLLKGDVYIKNYTRDNYIIQYILSAQCVVSRTMSWRHENQRHRLFCRRLSSETRQSWQFSYFPEFAFIIFASRRTRRALGTLFTIDLSNENKHFKSCINFCSLRSPLNGGWRRQERLFNKSLTSLLSKWKFQFGKLKR